MQCEYYVSGTGISEMSLHNGIELVGKLQVVLKQVGLG